MIDALDENRLLAGFMITASAAAILFLAVSGLARQLPTVNTFLQWTYVLFVGAYPLIMGGDLIVKFVRTTTSERNYKVASGLGPSYGGALLSVLFFLLLFFLWFGWWNSANVWYRDEINQIMELIP